MFSESDFIYVAERHGGIGDVAWVTPVLRYFKLHEDKIEGINGRNLKIVFSTQARNHFLLENSNWANGKRVIDLKIDSFPLAFPRRKEIIIPSPTEGTEPEKRIIEVISLPHKDIEDAGFVNLCKENVKKLTFKPDVICSLYESVERNLDSQNVNVYDYHFWWMGIDPDTVSDEDKLPCYTVREREAKDAEKIVKNCKGKFRIGIQMHSSSLPRTWDKGDKLIFALAKKYPDVAIYSFGDAHAQILEPSPHERPRNYMPLAGKTSNNGRLWAAVLSRMNLIISVDSGALHLAGALRIPLVGIFSTVKGINRIGYYKNAVAVDSKHHCSNCGHIGMSCLNSVPMPGKEYIPSLSIVGSNRAYPCLASITVDEVVAAVEKLI